MAEGISISRPRRRGPLISLVPMIDVMLILLVFFMVTSTYLDLDMIPAVRQQDDPGAVATGAPAGTLMIRLGADGAPNVQGRPLTGAALGRLLAARLAEEPLTRIVVLPSGAAQTQALITVMDVATQAGAQSLQVLRLEARP